MTGVLLIQLGTPDRPDSWALRRYLRQFLSDQRVIEVPKPIWQVILNLFILPLRPFASAKKYRRVWDPKTGSPLMHYTRRQAELLAEAMPGVPVRFAMQYGKPSVPGVLKEMLAAGVDRIVAMPMYPQYSGTTFGAATDALFKALLKERVVPAVRVVPPYYDHPAYLDAMATVIREDLARLPWTPDLKILSFHGIPQSYCQKGDIYATHVERTTQALVKRLGWKKGEWKRCYQSLFGRLEWLKPYFDRTVEKAGHAGTKKIFVALPGFVADCLETIDEIGHEGLEEFREAGGEELRSCPCLNDHPAWIAALREIILGESAGWIPMPTPAPAAGYETRPASSGLGLGDESKKKVELVLPR